MTLPPNPQGEILRPKDRQRLKALCAHGILTQGVCFGLLGILEPFVTHTVGPEDVKVPPEDTLDHLVHKVFPGAGPQCGDLKQDFVLAWWDVGEERIRLAARPQKNTLTAWVDGKVEATKRQFPLTPATLLQDLIGWLGVAQVAISQEYPAIRGMVSAIPDGPLDPILDE